MRLLESYKDSVAYFVQHFALSQLKAKSCQNFKSRWLPSRKRAPQTRRKADRRRLPSWIDVSTTATSREVTHATAASYRFSRTLLNHHLEIGRPAFNETRPAPGLRGVAGMQGGEKLAIAAPGRQGQQQQSAEKPVAPQIRRVASRSRKSERRLQLTAETLAMK